MNNESGVNGGGDVFRPSSGWPTSGIPVVGSAVAVGREKTEPSLGRDNVNRNGSD